MNKKAINSSHSNLWSNKQFLQYAENTVSRGVDTYNCYQDIVDDLLTKYPGFCKSKTQTFLLGNNKSNKHSFIQCTATNLFQVRLRQQQLTELRSLFKRDPESADMKWCLFISACQCYNYETSVSPFPQWLLKGNGEKDIDRLLRVIEQTPCMTTVYKQVVNQEENIMNDENLAVLHWVLIVNFKPHISTMSNYQIGEFFDKIHWKTEERPKYMFRLVNSFKSPEEESWKQFASVTGYKKLIAYHATRLENIHSIVHNGIIPYTDRRTIYGQGIYLISDLAVARRQCPYGYTWGGSRMGTEFACVCVCEFIDHPDMVKRQLTNETLSSSNIPRQEDPGNKYFVITNGAIIKVRYLMLYTRQPCLVPDVAIAKPEDRVSKDLVKRIKYEKYNVSSESSEDSLLGQKVKKPGTWCWGISLWRALAVYFFVLAMFMYFPPEKVKEKVLFVIDELNQIYVRLDHGKSYH